MRNLFIAAILIAAAGAPASLAAPVTYGINFTATEGMAPEAGSFTYDAATELFSNFTVNWGGEIFDLTASANAPSIVGTVACVHGLSGAAATFTLLNGKCGANTWGLPATAPLDSGDTLGFGAIGATATSNLTIQAFNGNAESQWGNTGGFAITANPQIGIFHPTGNMSVQREQHTATLLANGKVLVTGGENTSGSLASAELYNPTKGSFSSTGSMAKQRYAHTATLLLDGKVLIAGGFNSTGALAGAELYDPATGKFSATGLMTMARYSHTATLLPDGKVLIAGGYDSTAALASAELYDPKTGAFTATGSMTTARAVQTATLLDDGVVLIAGGYASPTPSLSPDILQSAELYHPKTGVFSTLNLVAPRAGHTATLLHDGLVLLTGGMGYGVPDKSLPTVMILASAELYGPKTGSPTGSMNRPRVNHTATLLPDGRVLLAGGTTNDTQISAQLYLPKFGTFSDTGDMTASRQFHTATLLPNGKVLIVGGTDKSHALKSAELFEASNGEAY